MSQFSDLPIRQAYQMLTSREGNPQQNLESAISTLEAALSSSPVGKPPHAWMVGQRLLADAYLQREAGDAGDNTVKAIAALEVLQQWTVPAEEPDAWSVTQVNLGQAYLHTPKGDAVQNRAKATAAFEAVLSLPLEAGPLPQAWGGALAWLTKLESVGDDHQFAARRVQRPEEELPRDAEWHVPWYLEDALHDAEQPLIAFIGTGEIPVRDEASRLDFDVQRLMRLAEMLGMLEERRSARQRTESLFQDVQAKGQPYVLFLRGFNNRLSSRSAEGVVLKGSGNLEFFSIKELVKSVAPTPVVWVGNPVESGAIDQMVAGVTADELGFRVEAGEDWQQSIRELIASASFIVMHNKVMTPGVLAEIEMLGEAGRLGDVFFADVEAASRASNRTDCRPLDSRALAGIAALTAPRPAAAGLPKAMCPWVEGARRLAMERETQAAARLLQRLEALRQPMFTDLMLDACAIMLGRNIVLENHDQLAAILARQAALYESLGGEFVEVARACVRLEQRVAASG